MGAAFEQYVSSVEAMKPNSIDPKNKNHEARMQNVLQSNEYIAEDKIDGCRYLALGPRFFSSGAVEKTDNFPHLRDFLIGLDMPNIILDGEISYPGKTSQYCTRVTGALPETAIDFQNANGPIHYVIWDILRAPNGKWLINEPLAERRKMLEHFYHMFVEDSEVAEYVRLSKFVHRDKETFYNNIIASGGEGVVLKRLDSLYVMGKDPMWQWMKLKQEDHSDLFIMGYDEPTVEYGGNNPDTWEYWKTVDGKYIPVTKDYYYGWVNRLVLGAYVNGEATQICKCSNFSEDVKRKVSEAKSAYLERVVRISFMEKTEAGYPRHPRFINFHETKLAHQCTWEFE